MSCSKTGDVNGIPFTVPNKPSTDKKEYRCFTLPNEMKVTLISDPETDKAAVAMDVHIGSLSDPRNVMGLAHFCEHMVFMGSEKFKEENIYSKYLSQHNGEYNAYTSSDHTNFYFEIKPENLFEAIDIFAQFFISPLFTESATDRELQAVNSEHEKNICNDLRRNLQLDRHLSNPNHDYNKFATGNLKTLKEDPDLNQINVRDELLKFHSKYYSSNIMSLCVLSQEPLDTLQDLVVSLFTPVVNMNIEIPFWENHPWTEDCVKQMVYISPIRECYEMYVTWPIPDYSKLYKFKPEHYVSHLIGHEGEGSILAHLKKKGWANRLSIGPNYIGNGIASMFLTLDLFEEGIDHIKEIVTVIYQYCAILKSQEPQEWIFNEDKKIKEMRFRYKENSNLQMFVSQVTHDMRTFDAEHILEGPYVMTEFRPDLIKNIIDCLSPTQMKVYCASKKFESKCTEEETWYKTKYLVENISKEDIEMWQNVELNVDLFLPSANQYIASDFSIKSNSDENISGPVLLRDNGLSRWWFCPDNIYLLPKAFVFIQFSNTLSIRDPVNMIMNYMIVDLFSDDVNEHIYDATLANLEFGINIIYHGVKMHFVGYNEKMPVFITDIITKLVKFVTDEKKFNALKENRFRAIRNFDAERPLYQADKLLSCLTSEVMWTQEDLLSTVNDITFENFQSYFQIFFSQLHTEALVYGNFKSNEVFSLMNDIEGIFSKHFTMKPLLKSQLTSMREILLPENANYVFHYLNNQQPTSALITYLQGQPQTARSNVVMKICNKLLSEPIFNQLRTEEQLGYIVGCNVKSSNSMQGHRIFLQSVKTPWELDERVNNFLLKFGSTLEEMSEDEYMKYLVGLRNNILEKPKDMMKQVTKYWQEIGCKHYNFNRDNEEAEELMKVPKSEIVDYYNRYVSPNSKYLKKLSIYVTSEKTHGSASSENIDPQVLSSVDKDDIITNPVQVNAIDDIVRFKKHLPLSSLIEPILPAVKDVPTAKL